MLSVRAVLEDLSRAELAALVQRLHLQVEDWRQRRMLLAALCQPGGADLAQIVAKLPVASLQRLCRQHALSASPATPANLRRRLLVELSKLAAPQKTLTARQERFGTAPPQSAAAQHQQIVRQAHAALKLAAPAKPLAKPSVKPLVKKVPRKTAQVRAKAAAKRVAKPVSKAVQAAQPEAPSPTVARFKPVTLTTASIKQALQTAPDEMPRPWLPAPPLAPASQSAQLCTTCGAALSLHKCAAPRCETLLLAQATRKICPECLFERNTLSMVDLQARLASEAQCPHCGGAWQAPD